MVLDHIVVVVDCMVVVLDAAVVVVVLTGPSGKRHTARSAPSRMVGAVPPKSKSILPKPPLFK